MTSQKRRGRFEVICDALEALSRKPEGMRQIAFIRELKCDYGTFHEIKNLLEARGLLTEVVKGKKAIIYVPTTAAFALANSYRELKLAVLGETESSTEGQS